MIDDIVSVTLTRTSRTVSQQGFSTLLILDHNLNYAARTIEFGKDELASLALALTGGTSAPGYIAAAAAFAQNPSVTSIKIGYRNGQKILTDDAGTYTAGSITATINGTDYVQAYDTDKDTTLTALAAQIQGDSAVSTAVYAAGSHTITITPVSTSVLSVSIDLSSITGTMTMALTSTATEDVDDALNAIVLYDDDWYGLVAVTRTEAEVQTIASWTESNEKIFGTASADTDIVDVVAASDTTSLPALFKAAAYERTFVMYYENAATEYPEAALFGLILSKDPGSYTCMFKTLSGVTRSLLTATQASNATDKNCMIYVTIGGVNVTREGVVAEGEYIDVIIFFDWLVARVQEAAYANFVANDKISYDDDGIQSIRNAIEPPFAEGITNKGIKPFSWDADNVQDGGYYFITPKRSEVSSVDVTNRELNGVKAYAFLAGAIHKVNIEIIFLS